MLALYDDATGRAFAPYALTRPLGEMRAGAELVRVRWERAAAVRAAAAVVAPHLLDFEELDAPPAAAGDLSAGTIVANSRCVVALGARLGDAGVWRCAGRVAAVRLAAPAPLAAFADGALALDALAPAGVREATLPGRWLDAVWDYVATLLDQLREDLATMGPALDCAPAPQPVLIGDAGAVFVERDAQVEPMVCFDVSGGPIVIRRDAHVRAFTRLMGPCYVAPGASVFADRVHGCAIGEACLVRGEISETVVLGHANKSHDGFVGHSYLGRWVNLGAGTITSNLKNTYGTVHLWTPAGVRDTGLVKLGAFLGDHVKTGIGTRLTTGSVIGAGSNVYGSQMPPKHVPPFSWGEGTALTEYRLAKFLQIAERAMARRGVALGDRERRQLAAAHALSAEARG